eukprot:1026266-Prymnesium_polylepis.2
MAWQCRGTDRRRHPPRLAHDRARDGAPSRRGPADPSSPGTLRCRRTREGRASERGAACASPARTLGARARV